MQSRSGGVRVRDEIWGRVTPAIQRSDQCVVV